MHGLSCLSLVQLILDSESSAFSTGDGTEAAQRQQRTPLHTSKAARYALGFPCMPQICRGLSIKPSPFRCTVALDTSFLSTIDGSVPSLYSTVTYGEAALCPCICGVYLQVARPGDSPGKSPVSDPPLDAPPQLSGTAKFGVWGLA